MTEYKDIIKMNDADLAELVSKEREVLRGLRFGKAERNSSAARQAKVTIARALTEQTKRAKENATKQVTRI